MCKNAYMANSAALAGDQECIQRFRESINVVCENIQMVKDDDDEKLVQKCQLAALTSS